MKAMIIRRIAQFMTGLLVVFYVELALAQPFPNKPIKIIVPYSAGGLVDAVARKVGKVVSDSIGEPVIVMDRPGADTIIGMHDCAIAAPNGYTLCLTSVDSLAYNPYMYKDLPYNPATDFAPVVGLAWTGRNTDALTANGKAPFNSIKELITYARAHPGAVDWGTWGPSSIPDIYRRWLEHENGIKLTAVPYKGVGKSVVPLLSGQIAITYMPVGLILRYIKAGKLKAIAVTTKQRSTILPNVPTLAEQGAGPELQDYFGLFAPHATPKPVVERLNAEFAKALRTPGIRKFLEHFHFDEGGASVEVFTKKINAYRIYAGKIFRTLDIHPKAING